MKLDIAINFVDRKIAELEQQLYLAENVVIPRYEQDKRILRQMRDQKLKMQVLKEKIDVLNKRRAAGDRIAPEEELTAEEIAASLPEVFR